MSQSKSKSVFRISRKFCGTQVLLLRHKITGQAYAQSLRCDRWDCPRCNPMKLDALYDLLAGQLADHHVRYFNTITIPLKSRDDKIQKQAEWLKNVHSKSIEIMARICAPNGEVYKNRASRSKTCTNITSKEEWQKRYETRLIPERERAIRYDAYVLMHILAQYIVGKQNEKKGWRSRLDGDTRIKRYWESQRVNRMTRYTENISVHYERAVERMTESRGRPAYYGTFEYHDDDKTLHIHSLSNIWISHYAIHSAVYGVNYVRKRLKAFERGEFVPLPWDCVYRSDDISDPEKQRKRLSRLDTKWDFDPIESFQGFSEESDDDLHHFITYITKSLKYLTKEIANTINSAGLRTFDFHSRGIVARPKDDMESNYERLTQMPIKLSLPAYRVALDEPTDGDWVLSAHNAANRYTVDYKAFNVYEDMLMVTMPEVVERLFPLRKNDRYWELKDKADPSKSELNELKRLQRYFDEDMNNFRVSILTKRSLARFTASPIAIPDISRSTRLDETQQEIIRSFALHPITLAHGPAGTGKSLTAVEVIKSYGLPEDRTLILAYTGKSANRLNQLLQGSQLSYRAQTVHSALAARYDGRYGHDEFHSLSHIQYLILDEIGIMPKSLFVQLLRSLGAQTRMLLLGDFRQLPPINGGSTIRELIDLNFLPTIELTKNYRSGDAIIDLANAVLDADVNNLTSMTEKYDENEVVKMRLDGFQVLTNTRKTAKSINNLLSNKTGENGIKLGSTIYSVNDPVIITKNDNSKGLLNGQMGLVTFVSNEWMSVCLEDGTVERYDLFNSGKIDLAYALTVHKAQGSEFDSVLFIVDLATSDELLTREIVYTAITRAKNSIRIMLRPSILNVSEQWKKILARESVRMSPHTYRNAEDIAIYMWSKIVGQEEAEIFRK